ncbi:hypothetical protein PVK06_010995 [Gossypium arboreum]|uniref:Uncharacterized protein n=1 Tax=Gossypium arboreum TaxID=29729 RepID=A0ABR0Q8B4_GOSAR|nr:hypothetical protein PVK06_010995 [Gossypium arboreum]
MVSCSKTCEGVTSESGDSMEVDLVMVKDDKAEEVGIYEPWMLVERKIRRNYKDSPRNVDANSKLRVKQEASTSVVSRKCIREPSGALGVRSVASISSNISTHLNSIFKGPMEVAVLLREGVLDPSKHTTIVFKKNTVGGKLGVARNGTKLNRTIRNQETRFKTPNSYRIPISKSINNMVDFISSQLKERVGAGGLNVAKKQLEAKDIIYH